MKIDFIIGSLQSGGAERVVCNLANYFSNYGYTVRIITFREGDAYKLNDEVQRVRYHKKLVIFNYTLVRAFVFLIRFYRKKNNRPDLISSHIHLMGLVTIIISKLFNIRITVSEHINHKFSTKSTAKYLLWNYLYKFADAVTILTSYDKAFFDKKSRKVVVMPNPCSFQPNKEKTKRNKIILSVGDLDRYYHKGFDNLLDIASEVLKKHPDWKFMIVGYGDKGLNILKEKAKQLNLEDNVIFAGFRKDVQQLMQSSAIFMLTSRFEGLPMGLMEASSQGIACIAFDCVSGPSDIIQNGHDGFLVKDQDIKEMVEKTNMLIEDETLRMNLSKNAIQSSIKYSVENIGEKWHDLFKEIIAKKG